jgi:hypothetical protein
MLATAMTGALVPGIEWRKHPSAPVTAAEFFVGMSGGEDAVLDDFLRGRYVELSFLFFLDIHFFSLQKIR